MRRPLMLRRRQPLLQPPLLVGREPQQPWLLPPHPQHPQQPHHHGQAQAAPGVSAVPRGASGATSEATMVHDLPRKWEGPFHQ